MMRLGNPDGADRLAAVGHRALRLGACSYKRIASIRKHALAPQPVPGPRTAAPGLTPGHSRGAPSAPPTQEPLPVAAPDPRHTADAATHRHGPSAQRADGGTGAPGAQCRRTPGGACRPRDDGQACPETHDSLTAGAVAPEGQPGSDGLSAPAGPRYSSPAAPSVLAMAP